ncbi:MAG TPA: peptide deformylase [bacterium]|nr:peptide deformylase [bacterium]
MILEIQKGKDNPILRKKFQPIKKIDENILKLARDMIETINKNNGIGLSACQVGKNIQMFVIIKELSKKQIFINPEIIKTSKKSNIIEEGCLSLPGVYLPIKRAVSLKIKAFDENNKQFKLKTTDLLAQAIQHEMDHLNGILITDHEPH